MAPVANPEPDMSGTASKASWPPSVMLRLKELQESLDEDEITRKGYWKQKYNIVEKFLSKEQTKNVSSLQIRYKDGQLSESDYFDKLKSILVPIDQFIDEGVKNEAEAMEEEDKENSGHNVNVDVKSEEIPAASSSQKPAVLESKESAKRSRTQPSIQDMFRRSSKRKPPADVSSTEKKAKGEKEADSGPAVVSQFKKPSNVVTARCKICRQVLDSPDLVR